MSDKVRIEYRLPQSCVRAQGTVSFTKDQVLKSEERTPEATVELIVIGDERELDVEVERGLLMDTDIALTLTDDGRLVSSSFEATGEVGKVVLATVGVAAFAAGIATGTSPLAIGAIAAAAGAAREKKPSITRDEDKEKERAEKDEIKDPVLKKYYKTYPDRLQITRSYAGAANRAVEKISQTAIDLLDADDAAKRLELARALRSYEQLLRALRSELDRLDALFKAWRATTMKTRTEDFEFIVPLDQLRGMTVGPQGEVTLGEETPKAVRELWESLGILVLIEGRPGPIDVPEVNDGNLVLVRQPRRVLLSVYKKADDGRAVLQSRRPYLVMDDRCEHEQLHFDKSWFGKRGQGLVFSSLGALVGYTSKQTSEAAGLADTVSGIPTAVVGSLEQSKKLLDDISALRTQGLDSRLATLKKQVELKQQEITQSGLLATEASFGELARLKQEAEILQQKKTIGGVTAAPDPNASMLADLKQQIELLSAQQELAYLGGLSSDT